MFLASAKIKGKFRFTAHNAVGFFIAIKYLPDNEIIGISAFRNNDPLRLPSPTSIHFISISSYINQIDWS